MDQIHCDECRQEPNQHEPTCKTGQKISLDEGKLSPEQLNAMFPFFNGSIQFAVFNIHDYDQRKARLQIINEFGEDAWKKGVLPYQKTGIMKIFQHRPTPILLKYAVYCGLAVEARIAREQRRRTPA